MNKVFRQQYEFYLGQVEKFLNTLPWEADLIGKSMKYSVLGGGKRLRPVLALACAGTVGGGDMDLVREAGALELIHTYSLIHDDLPAMDDDDYRRGRLANHKVFGEAAAILTGDALLTYAFELLAGPSAVPAEKKLRMIREIAHAAGWKGMVGGQVLDTLGNGSQITLAEIQNIHYLKTGMLMIASARLGAVYGGGTEEEIRVLTQYAAHLGLAFQIRDDILDVTGESATLGKLAGSDEKLAKPTFSSVLGLAGATRKMNSVASSAKEVVGVFGARAGFLLSLVDFVVSREN